MLSPDSPEGGCPGCGGHHQGPSQREAAGDDCETAGVLQDRENVSYPPTQELGSNTVEPLLKDTFILRTLCYVPHMLFYSTPEMRTPLYAGHFTRFPGCPQ